MDVQNVVCVSNVTSIPSPERESKEATINKIRTTQTHVPFIYHYVKSSEPGFAIDHHAHCRHRLTDAGTNRHILHTPYRSHGGLRMSLADTRQVRPHLGNVCSGTLDDGKQRENMID